MFSAEIFANLFFGICGFLLVFGYGELLQRTWRGVGYIIIGLVGVFVVLSLFETNRFDGLAYGGIVGLVAVIFRYRDMFVEIIRERRSKK